MCIGKASMVGFTLVSRSYYYLRRRSPGPPFPPDHRQAGERGATNKISQKVHLLHSAAGAAAGAASLLPGWRAPRTVRRES